MVSFSREDGLRYLQVEPVLCEEEKKKEKAASALLKLAFHWKDAEGRSVQLLAFQYSICKNIFSLISVYMS